MINSNESTNHADRRAGLKTKVRRGLGLAVPAVAITSLLGVGIVGAQTTVDPRFAQPQLQQPAFSQPGLSQSGLGAASRATTQFPPTRIDDILENPQAFIGRPVQVVGELEDVFGGRAFTLEDEDLAFDDEILILGAGPLSRVPGWAEVAAEAESLFGTERRVGVWGVVYWAETNLTNELGFRPSQEWFADFQRQPTVVALAVNIGNGWIDVSGPVAQPGFTQPRAIQPVEPPRQQLVPPGTQFGQQPRQGQQGQAGQQQQQGQQQGQQQPQQGQRQTRVTMQNIRYQPQQLTVASGTTVQWVNQDNVAHTVTSGTPQNPTGQFDSGIMQQGQQYSLTFDQPGTYQYFCEVHPFQMQAVVQVTSGGTGGGQAGQQSR